MNSPSFDVSCYNDLQSLSEKVFPGRYIPLFGNNIKSKLYY